MNHASSETTITNTFNGGGWNESYASVKVEKIWAGSENENQPKEIKVQLYQGGKAYGEPVTLNAAGGWKHTWTMLPDSNNYTVDEVAIPDGYTKNVTHTGNSWTITNVYDDTTPLPGPPEDSVTISGLKTWRHGSNPVESRPTEITVYIKNGREVAATVSTNAAKGWKYSAVLPKYDDEGKTIVYSVSEAPVDGYRAVLTGYNLTNIHVSGGDGGPKTGDDTASTLWAILMLSSAILIKILLRNTTLRRRKR